MYLRLALILLLFFSWGPMVCAQSGAPAQNSAPKEITLEVNAVQIILNDEHRNGIDWGAIVEDFHTALLKKEDGASWDDNKYRLSFGTVSQDDYEVLLDALDTVGRMSQFPQPPLTVVLGTPASVSLGVQNIRVDVLLTDLKSAEAYLHLQPHVALLSIESHDGLKVPVSALLTAQTDIKVENNTTIVIGGLMKEEEIIRRRKFPLLGDIHVLEDIPLLGLVFRNRGRLMQRTETIIFLTVRTNAAEAPQGEDAP